MFPSNKLLISSWKAAKFVKHLSPLWICSDNNQSPFCHHLEMSSSLQLVPSVLWIFLFHLSEDWSEIFNRNYAQTFLYWLFIWPARVSFGLVWGDPNWRSRGESLGEHCTQQSPQILWVLLSILLDWHQAEKNAQSLSKKSLYDAGIKNRWDTLNAEYLQVTYKHSMILMT